MGDFTGFTHGAGGLVKRSFSLLMKDVVPFTVLAILITLPQTLFNLATATDNPLDVSRTNLTISMILGLVLGPLATAALTYGVFQRLRGRDTSIGECIGKGLSFLIPVVGVAIVTGLAIGLGFLALVVPGIILACGLFVAPVVAVIEKTGVGASISRSWEITQGYKKTIFCIFILLAIVSWGLNFILTKAVGAGAVGILVGVPFYGFVAAFWATLQVVAYQELRGEKESTDLEELASVFD